MPHRPPSLAFTLAPLLTCCHPPPPNLKGQVPKATASPPEKFSAQTQPLILPLGSCYLSATDPREHYSLENALQYLSIETCKSSGILHRDGLVLAPPSSFIFVPHNTHARPLLFPSPLDPRTLKRSSTVPEIIPGSRQGRLQPPRTVPGLRRAMGPRASVLRV